MKRHALVLALIVSTLAVSVASAQSNLGFKRLGVAVGFVDPEHLDGTFSIGVFANHGTITPRIGLESRIDYWSQSQSLFGEETSFRDIAVGARGKYMFELAHSRIQPYAGAGLAFHFVHAEVTIPPTGGSPGMTIGDSSTKLGLDLGGGFSTPIGPRVDFLGELWYGFASDVDQLSLRVGMSRKLGM